MKKEYIEQEKRQNRKCRNCNHTYERHGGGFSEDTSCSDYKGYFHYLTHGRQLYHCECERFEP